jgi:hypothetical protein
MLIDVGSLSLLIYFFASFEGGHADSMVKFGLFLTFIEFSSFFQKHSMQNDKWIEVS